MKAFFNSSTAINYKAIVCTCIAVLLLPLLSQAQPADPGSDPFNNADPTPVNGGVAVVMVLAFLYGVYRIVNIKRSKDVGGWPRQRLKV